MIFVDTNYFLRFFLQDVKSQYLEVKKLFYQAAKDKISLTSSTIVFFEIYWVLRSYYNKDKTQTSSVLQKILDLPFLAFDEQGLLQESLNLFTVTNLGLIDCYNLSYARQQRFKNFKTFDEKLLKEFKRLNQDEA